MRKDLPAVLIIACAAVLITVGVIAGQHTEVLNKAVRVCMECVGIG